MSAVNDDHNSLKPSFHYPSWQVTGFHYPSTRAIKSTQLVKTGHPSTRPVLMG